MFRFFKKKCLLYYLVARLMPLAIKNMYLYTIKNSRFNLLLLFYILMNTDKNYTSIRLQLI